MKSFILNNGKQIASKVITIWFFGVVMVLSVLSQPLVSHATTAVIQLFEGLPETYNGEPGENWQGHHYLAEYFTDGASVSIGTIGIRTINSEKYFCIGWKNGLGSIRPTTGDKNHISVTLNQQSSMTWIYKKAAALTFDINYYRCSLHRFKHSTNTNTTT